MQVVVVLMFSLHMFSPCFVFVNIAVLWNIYECAYWSDWESYSAGTSIHGGGQGVNVSILRGT